MAQTVKYLPAKWETWVQSFGWENPLEKDMPTHSSILAWRIPMDRGAWWARQSMVGSWGRKESDTTEQLCTFVGRTDGEAEAPTSWPPGVKSQLSREDPDTGKDWGQEEKGAIENEMVGWYHRLNGHKIGQTPEMVKDRKAWSAVIHGVAKSQTWLSNWTTTPHSKAEKKDWKFNYVSTWLGSMVPRYLVKHYFLMCR